MTGQRCDPNRSGCVWSDEVQRQDPVVLDVLQPVGAGPGRENTDAEDDERDQLASKKGS